MAIDNQDLARAQALARGVAPMLAASGAAACASVAPMAASVQMVAKAFAPQVAAVQAVARGVAPMLEQVQTVARQMEALAKHLRVLVKARERLAHYVARAVAPHLLQGIAFVRYHLRSLISHLEHGPPTGTRHLAQAFLYECDRFLERVERRVQEHCRFARANYSKALRTCPAQIAYADALRDHQSAVRPLAASITRHAPPRPLAKGRAA
jgi:hypothetical protein